ncbi:MAG: chemotaxis protein CheB [Cyanobacteria bacterium P01_A01_bin.83]
MSNIHEHDIRDDQSDSVKSDKLDDNLIVVGIGASAGGLDALEQLFDNMPADSGAAFVVIQHLSPDFKSLMKEILGRRTQMKVFRVSQGMKLKPNSVYLIPPGKILIVEANILCLQERKKDKHDKPEFTFPIDLFFTSLAKNTGARAIGVVLSGSGSDGSYGLRAINEAGGIALVQDPDTAEFDGMPLSAISTGVVNRVLPVKELTLLIYKCIVSSLNSANIECVQNELINPFNIKTIIDLVLETENIDFSYYKTTTMSRRIHRRRLINQLQDVDSYIELLSQSHKERNILGSDLLINVTRFFRDQEAWGIIGDDILPAIVDQAIPKEELRFWIAGCSTGEEAYSLAILVSEAIENSDKSLRVTIFATDIDRTALKKASVGIYPQSIANDVDPERLKKYFLPKDDESYQVMRKLREMLIFSPQDLANDACFTRMHFVSCRNVLIYMKSSLQQRTMRNFHFSLKPKGILFLGEAESVGEIADEFDTLNPKWKIYKKRRNIRLPFHHKTPEKLSQSLLYQSSKPKTSKLNTRSTQEYTLQRILQDSSSTILLISRENRLLHVYGDSSQVIKPLSGEMAKDVSQMVISPLQLPLSAALHRAKKEQKTIIYRNLKLEQSNKSCACRLKVIPPQSNLESGDFYLAQIEQELVPTSSEISQSEQFQINNEAPQQILALEEELQYTRENLQALIEELETTNEEQQATNEELIASNEELQSTNEELHSVNEELFTVNSEYQSKIEELTELNNDVDNLLRSTDIGVVFLDRDLKIRKFTPAATMAINLVAADIDRPLEHITHNLDCPNLIDLLEEVMESQTIFNQEVKLAKRDFYLLMRINPYLSEDGYLNGLVITFIDIDELKTIQEQVNLINQELKQSQFQLRQLNHELENRVEERTKAFQQSEARLRAILATTSSIIYLKDIEGRYILANERCLDILNLTEAKLSGKRDHDFFPQHIAEKLVENDRQVLSAKSVIQFEERIALPNGNKPTYISIKAPLIDEEGEVYAICGISTDISQQKHIEGELRESVNRERTLLKIVEKIHQSLDLDEIFIATTKSLRETLKCDRVALYQFDSDLNGKFIVESIAEGSISLLDHQSMQDGWNDTCLRETRGGRYKNQETIAVQDIESANFSDCHRQIYEQINVKAFCIAPVFQSEQLWGLLAGYNELPRQWKDGEIRLLTQTGIQMGISIAQVDLLAQIQAKKAAEIANKAKDDFISRMSHELRTPLNSILGFSDILKNELIDDPEKLHSVNIVNQSGQHLLALINDILDFSKISAEKLELEPSELNLIQFLDEIARMFKLKAQEKKLTFCPQILPSVPLAVRVDKLRLRQILLNLLSNAFKFTETGKVSFTVGSVEELGGVDSPERVDSHNKIANLSLPKIRFQVEDTGRGIPNSKLEHIFAPFSQLIGSTDYQEGTGLGLSISRDLVQLMGGQIQVESKVSQGSKFWFDLELPEIEADLLPTSTEPIAAIKKLKVPVKILVVDDNYGNHSLLIKYLQSMNFTLKSAINGQEGLEIAKNFEPHAILTDLAMPVMDGREMISQIRQLSHLKNTLIIATSANSEFILQPSEVNCHAFLPKPIDLSQLLKILDTHLQLDWQLSESTSESTKEAYLPSDIVPPKQQDLLKLLEVVQTGDLEAIELQLQLIENKHSQYLLFLEQVRKLASSFQQNQLEKFIQNFIPNSVNQ